MDLWLFVVLNYNGDAVVVVVVVGGFGLFRSDTAAFEPSPCPYFLFSTSIYFLFFFPSPHKAFFSHNVEGRALH